MNKHHFNIILSDSVATDIQEAVDYYKEKQKPLGRRFYDAVKKSIQSLEKEALLYQIRYKKFAVVALKNFRT